MLPPNWILSSCCSFGLCLLMTNGIKHLFMRFTGHSFIFLKNGVSRVLDWSQTPCIAKDNLLDYLVPQNAVITSGGHPSGLCSSGDGTWGSVYGRQGLFQLHYMLGTPFVHFLWGKCLPKSLLHFIVRLLLVAEGHSTASVCCSATITYPKSCSGSESPLRPTVRYSTRKDKCLFN